MSGTAGARFPIRLDPIPGESFDGWIDAYAQRLLMPPRELARSLGLPGGLVGLRGCNVAKGGPSLDPEEIAARACGIDAHAIAALWSGLRRYDRLTAERLARAEACPGAIGWLRRVLAPMVSSRWCPTCLTENGGRWPAVWRVPWFLACPVHETILCGRCPACGGTQRAGGLRAKHLPALMTICSRPAGSPGGGHHDCRCRHDLTTTPVGDHAPPALISVQTEMAAILDSRLDDGQAGTLADRLVDVMMIATRVGLHPGAIDRDRGNLDEVLREPLIAAHAALADPRGGRMHAIANADPARVPAALPQTFEGVSHALAGIIIGHRDHRLGPTERLRHRSMTTAARRPEGADLDGRLRAIPFAIWPDWSIRLRPADAAPDTFRIDAAMALCIPGSTDPTRVIRDRWPGACNKQRLVKFGQRVLADRHGDAILSTLCALAETLDRHGAPIDYERRRDLAARIELLDPRAWAIICRADGGRIGGRRKLTHARLWVWEALTGGLPKQAPPALRLARAEFLADHRRFSLVLPAATARRLEEHARHLLDRNGCCEEPLSWSPPVDGIRLGDLPGDDPDRIDPRRVHDAIATQPTPRDAAAESGITLEQLRYTARAHPT